MSETVEQEIIELIATHADIKPNLLTADMMIKDTGIDSIGTAELMYDIEEHYNIVLDNSEQLQDRFELGSISDLAKILDQKIEHEKELTA